MKSVHAALAAALVLLLAACYPPSTANPAGTPAKDARIAGLWLGTTMMDKEPHKSWFHFLPQGDGTITTVMVDADAKPGAGWSTIHLTTARLGGATILNARMLQTDGKPEEGEPNGTIPLLYRFDAKGQMLLYLLDDKATKAAIKAGKISGTVGQGDDGDAIITADPAALDKFLSTKEGLALFGKQFAVLHKVP
jgi:hypothetical protein